MMYRNFAIATLIGAPLIVLAVQSVMPTPPPAGGTAPVEVAPPAPITPPPPPPVAPPSSYAPATGMGQPMSDAGQPSLSPGQGLPDASSSAMGGSYVPGTAPAGSPNAEP